MLIKNYKRINYLKFNLSDTKYILNKDYFQRHDLMEALKMLFSNKKSNGEAIIKWTELDTMYDLKISKLIFIPSILDFQKDFLNGNKSIFKNLVTEIITILEAKNNSLIEIQNLLFNFRLENEFPLFQELLENTGKKLDIELNTTFSSGIAQIIADYYCLELTSQGERITENNVSSINLKKLYFYFLDCFRKCCDETIIFLFDDPFLGLNYQEGQEILLLLEWFKNKIIVASWLPILPDSQLENLCLWNGEWFRDLSDVFNDLGFYQQYVDKPLDDIAYPTLKLMLESFNLYDQEHPNHLKYDIKDMEILWKVIINQI